MQHLLGEYDCKIDAKGRMRLPSALIAQLEEKATQEFVLNRGLDQCIALYPADVWTRITEKVNQLNTYNAKNRAFVRRFYRGATHVSMDSADRILLSKRLLEYANIEKEAIVFAYNDQIEIWAKNKYDAFMNEESDDFDQLAEEVLGTSNTPDLNKIFEN